MDDGGNLLYLERLDGTFAAGARQLEILPLTVEVAIASERFTARFPKDPADRIIAATAIVHGLTLLTADRHLRRSKEVPTLW